MGGNKISASGVSPKWVKNNRRRGRGKLVITMASYALQTPPGFFYRKKIKIIEFFFGYIFSLKYWWKQIFSLGSFPRWVKSKRRRERRKKQKLIDSNNNGQLRIATPPRVAHVKPPGPICDKGETGPDGYFILD